jgi:hypothetical protein
MLLPTKHQDLNINVLVLGADILHFLKKEGLTIEEVYQKLKTEKNVALEYFFDTITFLWLIDAINFNENKISKCI